MAVLIAPYIVRRSSMSSSLKCTSLACTGIDDDALPPSVAGGRSDDTDNRCAALSIAFDWQTPTSVMTGRNSALRSSRTSPFNWTVR